MLVLLGWTGAAGWGRRELVIRNNFILLYNTSSFMPPPHAAYKNCTPQGNLSESVEMKVLLVEAIGGDINPCLAGMHEL
jgi:hypothetical protein